MQMGFYFDQTRCTGCFTCIVACKDWNDVPAGPASWRRVKTIEKGNCPDLFVAFISNACYHCTEPACIPACPVNAISKRETDGVVVVDQGVCLGKDSCGMCLQACPYDAPQFGAEENAEMQKCHFCLDRLAKGKKPACVDSCPMRAMDAGPLTELRDRYGNFKEAEGFAYSEKLTPSIVFKPKKNTKGLAIEKVEVAPFSQIAVQDAD
jgi:anaerobic dimethyl sulfoxide reductase subunit B (iron-sulfur subunit)